LSLCIYVHVAFVFHHTVFDFLHGVCLWCCFQFYMMNVLWDEIKKIKLYFFVLYGLLA